MTTLTPRRALDARVLLDMMRLQLNYLEREMLTLQRTMPASDTLPTARPTFAALRGAWAGVIVTEQDLQAARLALPEGLM